MFRETEYSRRRREQGLTLMELLIVCIIGSIVTGGMIFLWFNINRSSAMTVSHAETRDFARDGIARLSREIRDAEAAPETQAIQEATANDLSFYTTFNQAGNEISKTTPRLVHYRYVSNGMKNGVETYRLVRQVEGETGQRIVIPYLLNDGGFSYTYMTLDQAQNKYVLEENAASVPEEDYARILTVRIHVLVDLDPGKAPNPMEITTAAQLRNQRIIE